MESLVNPDDWLQVPGYQLGLRTGATKLNFQRSGDLRHHRKLEGPKTCSQDTSYVVIHSIDDHNEFWENPGVRIKQFEHHIGPLCPGSKYSL